MKKISKIFLGVSSFYTVICSKVFGVSGLGDITPLYGIPEPKLDERTIGNMIILLPAILGIIGFFIFINKKITKKTKKIIMYVFLFISMIVFSMSLIKDYLSMVNS